MATSLQKLLTGTDCVRFFTTAELASLIRLLCSFLEMDNAEAGLSAEICHEAGEARKSISAKLYKTMRDRYQQLHIWSDLTVYIRKVFYP